MVPGIWEVLNAAIELGRYAIKTLQRYMKIAKDLAQKQFPL